MPKTSPRPGRGRPRLSENDRARTRQRIADCALSLFQQQGYEAVSMRRIAREADCTVMTLYRYFDRKIDLLRYLWAEIFNDLFAKLVAIANHEPEASGRLLAIARAYVQFWLEQREQYFLVFMSSGVSQPDVSIFVEDDGVVEQFLLFQRSVADTLDEPLDSPEVNLKTQSLLCSLNGIAHNLITISAYPWEDPDTLVRSAVSGIRSRSQPRP